MVYHPNIWLLVLSFLYNALPTQSTPQHNWKNDFRRQPRGVKWIEPNRTAFIRLETPDLPLWNTHEGVGELKPSNFIIEFRISPDNTTLLMQGLPILPLADSNIPPKIYLPQTGKSYDEFYKDEVSLLSLATAAHFGVDYRRIVRPRDRYDVQYLSYNPEIFLDIIGAGIDGYDALLDSKQQKSINIKLTNTNRVADFKKWQYEIEDIWLNERGRYRFPDLENREECTLWSWRCEEIATEPWYRIVLRREFDQWGRIGSLRHELVMRWATFSGKIGAILLGLVAVGSVWMLGYAATLLWKQTRDYPEIGRRLHGESEEGGYEYVVVDDGEDDLDSEEEIDEKVEKEEDTEQEMDEPSRSSSSNLSRKRYRKYKNIRRGNV